MPLAARCESSFIPMGLPEFNLFRTLIYEHTGIWLRDGKQVMLASRLMRRLRHHAIKTFAEYYELVGRSVDNGGELRELINCVTTNKTSFFRERHHFEYLADTVVPRIQSGYKQGAARVIRVWSACCSTGEEPYSIAITLLEALQAPRSFAAPAPAPERANRREFPGPASAPGSWKVEIIASDIDTNVLDVAARAVYSEDAIANIPPQLRRRYFLRGNDNMRGRIKIKPEVAQLVRFKRINLKDADWPLEGLFDVIFFRNALIYFNRQTQEVFLRKMAGYLKPKGHLFLGSSEHIPWLTEIFAPLRQTMYQLRDVEQ